MLTAGRPAGGPRLAALPAVGLIVIAAALAGCGAASPASVRGEVPTVSPLFDAQRPAASPTATRDPSAVRPTPTTRPSATGTATAPAAPSGRISELVIYDDVLASDWSADNSWDVKVDLADRTHVYSGSVAAAVTPLEDYGALFLALKPGAKSVYSTTDVLGVSVWINSGNDELSPEDLAVTVIGSNDYTYWVRGDASVQLDDLRFFSESRLMYLGITRVLAPERWVEAVVRLDQLPYEPDYRYVTGVYVKNDKGFRRTYYVDRVALLLVQSPVP